MSAKIAGPSAATPNVEVSKAMSTLLRHRAAQSGLEMDSAGFVKIADLLQQPFFRSRHITEANICAVAAACPKQRFMIVSDPTDGSLLIRAAQGHTLRGLDDTALHQPLTLADAQTYPVAIHGTTAAAWELIRSEGLKPMAREHVHFAVGLPGESGVISGMRVRCEVLIYIDVAAALAAGLPLVMSSNRVILSRGMPGTGVIPPALFSRVVYQRDGVASSAS